MTIRKVLIAQAVLIVLMGIFALLAQPFYDNRIERKQYETENCATVEDGLGWHCRNHSWILLGSQILFVPGFIAVLLLPLTGLIAYVSHSQKKGKDGKGSE